MPTFDEAKHPRGQVKNKGQFTKSTESAWARAGTAPSSWAQFGSGGSARDWAVRMMNRMGGHDEAPGDYLRRSRPALQGNLFPSQAATEAHSNIDAIKGRLAMITRLAATAKPDKLEGYVEYVKRANAHVVKEGAGSFEVGDKEDMKARAARDQITASTRAATMAVLGRLSNDMKRRADGAMGDESMRESAHDWKRFQEVASSDPKFARLLSMHHDADKDMGSVLMAASNEKDQTVHKFADLYRTAASAHYDVSSDAHDHDPSQERINVRGMRVSSGAERPAWLQDISRHSGRAQAMASAMRRARMERAADEALQEQARTARVEERRRANTVDLEDIKARAAEPPHPSFKPVHDAVKKALADDPREEVRNGHVVMIATDRSGGDGATLDPSKSFDFRFRLYTKDGRMFGEMSRTSVPGGEIHNNVFTLHEDFQKGGLALSLQKNLFDAYRKAGYTKVTVDAAGSARQQIKAVDDQYCGNISWAALGFTWQDARERTMMRDQFHGWLRYNRDVREKFEEQANAKGRTFQEHLDAVTKHPWELSRLKIDGVEGEKQQAGKLFLAQSGQWWKGKFDLAEGSISDQFFSKVMQAKAASSKTEAS